jgi:hypothetical protein
LDVVERLSQILRSDIRGWWDYAWLLHVEGFHEAGLRVEHVKAGLQYVICREPG